MKHSRLSKGTSHLVTTGLLVYNPCRRAPNRPTHATGKSQLASHSPGWQNFESGVIRVLIADDHPVVCLGLLGIINVAAGMIVVGQAKSGTAAVALARKLSPDVILMDLRMPENERRRRDRGDTGRNAPRARSSY